MGAIIVISYFVACLIVGMILTTFVAMFRSVSGHDKFMSWRWTLGFALLLAVAPYAYMEGMTRKHGPDVEKQVTAFVTQLRFKGDLSYFRVTNADDSMIRCLAVVNENTSIRFVDRVVVELIFIKDKNGKWVIDQYEVLSSFERNKDKIVIPPML
jgi:hypothetical protein